MKQRYLSIVCSLCTLAACIGTLPLARAAAAPVPPQAVTRPTLDEKSLVVYPNPSTGIVHLTITGLEGRRVEVSVLNVIGTTVYRETLTELNERYTKTLDLSRLASGLYYVKIEADNASQLCKLVIH